VVTVAVPVTPAAAVVDLANNELPLVAEFVAKSRVKFAGSVSVPQLATIVVLMAPKNMPPEGTVNPVADVIRGLVLEACAELTSDDVAGAPSAPLIS
jgi:hypothetical protein